MAEALYRKYRPQIFEDVVGQEHIERTIKNAIEQDKVSHAYLFCGPRGTGKTTTARLLAKALLCESGPTAEPDGTCEMCELVAKGEHPDVYELDAASRTGVENVREEIIGRVHYAPTRGRYKIYIIDEVHMLSVPAFNALLKTLEEPPAHVVFILATTDPQKVPETIHSRCQRFDFRRIDSESMVSRLGAICTAEEVECEPEALELIAHRADGGMRNALTSLEQLIVFCGGNVTLDAAERMLGGADSDGVAKLMRAVGDQDAAACFQFVDELAESGSDVATFVRQMAQFARNLYVMSLAGAKVELPLGPSERRELEAVAPAFGPDRASRMLGVLGDLQVELKTSTNQRLSLEIALTRMVRPQADLTMEALAQRLETLERGFAALSSGAAAPIAVPATFAAPAVPALAPAPASAVSAAAAPAAIAAASARPVASVTAAAPQPAAAAQMGASAPVQAAPASASAPMAGAPALQPTAAQAGVSAPAAPASPAAQPPAPSGLANPAVVQRLWQAVLGAARAQGGGLATFLGWASASYSPATGGIVATFDGSQQFVYNQVQKPENVRFVAQVLQATFGQPVPFAFALGSAGAVAAAPAARPAPQPAAAPAQPNQGGGASRSVAQSPAAGMAGAAVAMPTPAPAPAVPAAPATQVAAQPSPGQSAPAPSPAVQGVPASPATAGASPQGDAQAPATGHAAAAVAAPRPSAPAAPVQPSASAPGPQAQSAPASSLQAQPAPAAPAMAMPAEPPDTTSAASAARSAAVEVSGEGGGAEYLQSVLAAGGFGQAITVSDVSGGSVG